MLLTARYATQKRKKFNNISKAYRVFESLALETRPEQVAKRGSLPATVFCLRLLDFDAAACDNSNAVLTAFGGTVFLTEGRLVVSMCSAFLKTAAFFGLLFVSAVRSLHGSSTVTIHAFLSRLGIGFT